MKPLIATFILVLVFNRFIGLESAIIPYPLMVISGFLIWNLFSSALSAGYVSLVSDQILVTHIYIPRLLIPLSSVLSNLTEALITFVIIILLSIFYGVEINSNILLTPLILLTVIMLAYSFSLFLSIIYAKYRDLGFVVPFCLQIGFYLSPIAYGRENISSDLMSLYYLNPFASIIESFRWCLYGSSNDFDFTIFIYPFSLACISLIVSLIFFSKYELNIGDVI
jgi:lipopolysaccharide transport system permease protein